MSEIRRKLLIDSVDDKFKKVVAAINKLPGQKSILRKFDDSQLVWVLTFANRSATSHDLYVFDLKGNMLGRLRSLSSIYHYGAVINNYACIYSGTKHYSLTFDVIQLTENGLTKIRNSVNVNNWVNNSYFGYKDINNNYHMCAVSNDTHNCVFDYNITQNTVRRTESTRHYFIQWYNYDEQYFRGIIWNSGGQSDAIYPSYIKRTDTINTFSNYNFSPSISDAGDYIQLIPIFDYKMSYDDLPYEMYYCPSKYKLKWYNILGLNTQEPTSLSIGNIILTDSDNIYMSTYYGMLSYIKNGEFHAYSYNQSTGLIDLMI